jgi:acyl carrier protein
MSVNSTKKIRRILEVQGRLGGAVAKLTDTANLYHAGLTSHATVNVMLALEGEFGVEFPDSMLKRSVFESITAIRTAVEGLTRK